MVGLKIKIEWEGSKLCNIISFNTAVHFYIHYTETLFYLTTVACHFPLASLTDNFNPKKFQNKINNVFVRCDALLRTEGKYFQHFFF